VLSKARRARWKAMMMVQEVTSSFGFKANTAKEGHFEGDKLR
jgi:hypothetical protein